MRCYQQQGRYVLAFGLGLIVSCFFPASFIVGVIAIVMIILAISLIKC